MGVWKLLSEEQRERITKHNEICDGLREKGYEIQGCGNDFRKCYFSEGKAPYTRIAGYIDNKTLEVVFL